MAFWYIRVLVVSTHPQLAFGCSYIYPRRTKLLLICFLLAQQRNRYFALSPVYLYLSLGQAGASSPPLISYLGIYAHHVHIVASSKGTNYTNSNAVRGQTRYTMTTALNSFRMERHENKKNKDQLISNQQTNARIYASPFYPVHPANHTSSRRPTTYIISTR